jgi:hypothetical protein
MPQITNTYSRVLVIDVNNDTADAIARGMMAAYKGHRFMIDRDAGSMGDAAAQVLRRALPEEALEQLSRFRRQQRQILHFKNLDRFDVPLPPTPVRGFGDDPRVQFYDGLLLGIFSLSGYTPVAFEFENFGRLMRNVVPNPDSKGQKSSHGFDEPLGWHIDNPCGIFEGVHTPWIRMRPQCGRERRAREHGRAAA